MSMFFLENHALIMSCYAIPDKDGKWSEPPGMYSFKGGKQKTSNDVKLGVVHIKRQSQILSDFDTKSVKFLFVK